MAVAISLYFLAQYRQISEPSPEAVVGRYFPAEQFVLSEQIGIQVLYLIPLIGAAILSGVCQTCSLRSMGRMNLHNDARLTRLFATWQGYPGWQSDPELTQARLVVADLERPLTSLLRLDRRFRLVYEDSTAAVFVARE